MPDDYGNLLEEIRYITDYPEEVYDDDEIVDGIQFTEGEIRGILENPELEFEDDGSVDRFNARRALMWATCYHLKVKSGEIGGMPMSIGDVDMSRLLSRGEPAVGSVFDVLQKFQTYLDRLDGSPRNFRSSTVSRSDRQYSVPGRVYDE